MKNLKIFKYPAKILRQKTDAVSDPLNPQIQELIGKMTAAMQSEQGLGLAAPQVGKSLKLCLVNDEGEILVLINPKITAFSKKKIIINEGCLSFPGKFCRIERPEKIKVRYLDAKGQKKKLKALGITARAIQHEIDHLNGILLIDKNKK